MSSTLPVFAQREFRKASASQPNRECVRVARRDGWVEVRDDKTTFDGPEDVRLVFTEAQFDAFLRGMRSGETSDLCLAVSAQADRTYTLRSTVPQPSAVEEELVFTEGEIQAFLDGVARGEFDRDTTSNMAVSA